jgi:hypothetical protein
MRRFMHPCHLGAKCAQQGNPIHWKLWYHSDYVFPDAASPSNALTTSISTPPAPTNTNNNNGNNNSPAAATGTGTPSSLVLRPICQNSYPCPQQQQHGAEFRHPCNILMATGTCPHRNDPQHRQLWREVCPDGARCQRAMDGEEDHKSEYLHLCENGSHCQGQSDRKHTLYYYHRPAETKVQQQQQQQQQQPQQNALPIVPQPIQPQIGSGYYPQQQYPGYPVTGAPLVAPPPPVKPSHRAIIPLSNKARCSHPTSWSCPSKSSPEHQAQFTHPCLTSIIYGTCMEANDAEHAAAFTHPCPGGFSCPELKNGDHKLTTLHACPLQGKGCKDQASLVHAAGGLVWYHPGMNTAPSAVDGPTAAVAPSSAVPGLQMLPPAVPVQASVNSISQLLGPGGVVAASPVAAAAAATGPFPELKQPCYNDQPPSSCGELHDGAHRSFYRHACREGHKCPKIATAHPEHHSHLSEWYHQCPMDSVNRCAPHVRTPLHNYQWYHKPPSF